MMSAAVDRSASASELCRRRNNRGVWESVLEGARKGVVDIVWEASCRGALGGPAVLFAC
jgi:hypothetical protein